MGPDTDNPHFDEQDQSEVFDEDNYTLDGAGDATADMQTLEEIPDVYDVTSAVGDADDDAAAIGEELDDEEIAALEEDAELADFEDDELAARMPEALEADGAGEGLEDVPFDGEPGPDAAERKPFRASADEVELVFQDDVEDTPAEDAEPAVLEAEALSDDDVEELGYAATADDETDQDRPADGRPGEPTRFEIVLRDKLWVLSRDGREIHQYGHAERAVHEAAEMARELRRTGEPAEVFLETGQGARIQITDDDPPPRDPEDETSSVVPDRSLSA
jgi:hypothetical protein